MPTIRGEGAIDVEEGIPLAESKIRRPARIPDPIADGFIKLEEPEVADPLYVAIKSPPEDEDSFDFLCWEPAAQALEESVFEEDKRQYYDVLVYYEDDTLCVLSSRGKVEPNMLKDQV